MANLLNLHTQCPVCREECNGNLGKHLRHAHGERALMHAVVEAKQSGMSDAEIGARFGITFRQMERLLTLAHGANIAPLPREKPVKRWEPKAFQLETTTVWSFKQRGDWATHNGRYRGNWSPYIPRNLILRYSRPGEVVIDPFVGGGTTAVEAKLLGRRCVGIDINPACVELTRQSLQFTPPASLFSNLTIYEPEIRVGDARNLAGIDDESIDLICAHPPYAGIIEYSPRIDGDLSQLGIGEFVRQMEQVARECYRVLKPGRHCAVLIGDTRRKKHVVPIGFEVVDAFLRAGFRLKELVIKRQHNCKTTGFWAEKSVRYNFLLLAHEYLPVFEKPAPDVNTLEENGYSAVGIATPSLEMLEPHDSVDPETTSVWIVPGEQLERLLRGKIAHRYSREGRYALLITSKQEQAQVYSVPQYLNHLRSLLSEQSLTPGAFVIIEAADVRAGHTIIPLAKQIHDSLKDDKRLWLKEIIIVAPEAPLLDAESLCADLTITHRYLLVYEVVC